MNDQLKDIINKIPINLFLAIFIIYQGYLFYQFNNDSESPVNVKKKEIKAAKDVKVKLDEKLKVANDFVKTLERKKAEIRKLTLELQNMKETLSDRSDVPTFMKMIITESKKLGITVLSLKPVGNTTKEYYIEQNFKFTFRCVFAQMASLLERLTNVSEIIRVDTFELKPVGNGMTKFVLLDVAIEMKTYKYVGSAADKVSGEGPLTGSSPAPTAGSSPSAGKTGGT